MSEDLRGVSFQEDAGPVIKGAVSGAGVMMWRPVTGSDSGSPVGTTRQLAASQS